MRATPTITQPAIRSRPLQRTRQPWSAAICASRRPGPARPLLVAALVASLLAGAPAGARGETGASAIAWGWNAKQQLDAGYKSGAQHSPVSVVGLTNITAMSSGYGFSLALLEDGTVRSWGGNAYGQLGDGSRLDSGTPVAVGGSQGVLREVQEVSGGGLHAMALLRSGRVMVWGNDEYGQLGNGVLNPNVRVNKRGERESTMRGTARDEPVEVPGLGNVTAVTTGNLALTAQGTVMAWGKDDKGQLGLGSAGPEGCKTAIGPVACSTRPRPVVSCGGQPLSSVIAVSAGREAGYALLANHTVVSWGSNAHGQLGSASAGEGRACAAPVEDLSGVTAISGGDLFALALLQDGRVVGWGANGVGQIGQISFDECNRRPDSCSKTPREVQGLTDVSAISAGRGYSLALSNGMVYAFGDNEPWGQLGIGSRADARTPTPIPIEGPGGTGAPVTAIVAGEQHSLALLAPVPALSAVQEPPAAQTPPVCTGSEPVVTATGRTRRARPIPPSASEGTEPVERARKGRSARAAADATADECAAGAGQRCGTATAAGSCEEGDEDVASATAQQPRRKRGRVAKRALTARARSSR